MVHILHLQYQHVTHLVYELLYNLDFLYTTKLTDLGIDLGESLMINGEEVFKLEDIKDEDGNVIKVAANLTISEIGRASCRERVYVLV